MTTKTIRITKDVREKLDTFADGNSFNKAVRKLLKNVEPSKEIVECSPEYCNIHIDEDLVLKLKQCKLFSSETHSDVINRLLDEALKK